MPIEDLLTETSHNLFTIEPNKVVGDAIELLAGNDIGALPVCDAKKEVVGIISERDIVRICSGSDDNWKKLKISDIMKVQVVSATPGDKIRDIVRVMKENDLNEMLREQSNKCYWYGVELSWNDTKKFPSNYSLDRLDPKGNYTFENCVLCCYAANIGRGDCKKSEWRIICEKIKSALRNV